MRAVRRELRRDRRHPREHEPDHDDPARERGRARRPRARRRRSPRNVATPTASVATTAATIPATTCASRPTGADRTELEPPVLLRRAQVPGHGEQRHDRDRDHDPQADLVGRHRADRVVVEPVPGPGERGRGGRRDERRRVPAATRASRTRCSGRRSRRARAGRSTTAQTMVRNRSSRSATRTSAARAGQRARTGPRRWTWCAASGRHRDPSTTPRVASSSLYSRRKRSSSVGGCAVRRVDPEGRQPREHVAERGGVDVEREVPVVPLQVVHAVGAVQRADRTLGVPQRRRHRGPTQAAQLVERPALHRLARADDRHAAAEHLHLRQDVARQQHRAAFVGNLPHDLLEHRLHQRVQPAGRLVHEVAARCRPRAPRRARPSAGCPWSRRGP